tara:strand:+ start:15462 stop:15575 length:114 start_codon:yes stop_codon:yes gene_type:complete
MLADYGRARPRATRNMRLMAGTIYRSDRAKIALRGLP